MKNILFKNIVFYVVSTIIVPLLLILSAVEYARYRGYFHVMIHYICTQSHPEIQENNNMPLEFNNKKSDKLKI